jgi:hypothetical protein
MIRGSSSGRAQRYAPPPPQRSPVKFRVSSTAHRPLLHVTPARSARRDAARILAQVLTISDSERAGATRSDRRSPFYESEGRGFDSLGGAPIYWRGPRPPSGPPHSRGVTHAPFEPPRSRGVTHAPSGPPHSHGVTHAPFGPPHSRGDDGVPGAGEATVVQEAVGTGAVTGARGLAPWPGRAPVREDRATIVTVRCPRSFAVEAAP